MILGADFCYFDNFWGDEYQELYKCLEEQSIKKDSSFCNKEYEQKLVDLEKTKIKKKICIADAAGDKSLEKKCEADYIIEPVQIESLYECYAQFGIANDKNLNCQLDSSVHFENMQLSLEAEVSSTSHVTEGKCYHTKGAFQKEKAWFKASFEETATVGSVDINNIEINDEEQGVSSTGLAGATIYIDDKECAIIPKDIPVNKLINVPCVNPDASSSADKEFLGIEGNSIRIEGVNSGVMTICDIRVQKGGHKHEEQANFDKCRKM